MAVAVLFILLSCGVLCAQPAPENVLVSIQDRIANGDLDGATAGLDNALKKYPNEGGLYNLRGIIHAKRNDFTAAQSDFAKAVRLNPQLTSAYLNLGRVYEIQSARDPSAIERATDLYSNLLKRQPGAADARLQLAKMLEWRGKYAASLLELDRLPPSLRDTPLALSLRCADLAVAGNLAGAGKVAADLLRIPETNENDVNAILPALTTSKAYVVTVQLLEGLMRSQTLSAGALQQLAFAYEKLGQLKQARKTLESVATENPKSVEPLLLLARVAYQQHDREGALSYLAHARDLDPKNAAVHFFFGIVSIELDLPIEAKKSLGKALDLDPANPAYNYARGAVELQGPAAWNAIPYFQKYIAARPDDPRGHFALGVAEFASHNYDAAAKEMESVARDKETAAGAEYFLGRVAKANSDWANAAEHLERSIKVEPNYAEAHAELGLAKMHTGDLDGARKELDRALELNPASYLVNANLLTLYQRTKDSRVEIQKQKMHELEAKRSKKQELMLRVVEVRPY